MKKAIAKKWARALRSGKYKKTMGQLKRGKKSYCCLGVLCELSKLGEWDSSDSYNSYGPTYLGSDSTLPPKVRRWAGTKNSSGNTVSHSLVDMNDSGKYSFKDIAKFIESNYKEL